MPVSERRVDVNADRETRRQLQSVWAELASTSERARAVMAVYSDAIISLERAADQLWGVGELRFSAALESRVMDLEVQARRNLQAIADREREAAKAAADASGGEQP